MRSSLVNRFFALSLAAAVGFTGTDVSALAAAPDKFNKKKGSSQSVEYVLTDFDQLDEDVELQTVKVGGSIDDIVFPNDLRVKVKINGTDDAEESSSAVSSAAAEEITAEPDDTTETTEETVTTEDDQGDTADTTEQAGSDSSDLEDNYDSSSVSSESDNVGSSDSSEENEEASDPSENAGENAVNDIKEDTEETDVTESVSVSDEHREAGNNGTIDEIELTEWVDLSEITGNNELEWSIVDSESDGRVFSAKEEGCQFVYEPIIDLDKNGYEIVLDTELPQITVMVGDLSPDEQKGAVPLDAGANTVGFMGQIKWDDEENGWNELIRPTKVPADPNELITLWKYTDGGEPEQIELQSNNESGANFCKITATAGEIVWSYSIGNVSEGENDKFYVQGPAYGSYKKSEKADELTPGEGDTSDQRKFPYIVYKPDFKSLTINKVVIPSDAAGSFSFSVKVGDDKVPYQGGYAVVTTGDVSYDGTSFSGDGIKSTENGKIAGVSGGKSAVLKIPYGVSYEVTEDNAGSFKTSYDAKKIGEIGNGSNTTTVTNISNNAAISMNKIWNDNNDPNRDEKAFLDSLVLEYRLSEGENEGKWAVLGADAQTELGIEGTLSYAVDKPGFSNWIVNVTHGGSKSFPAALVGEDGSVKSISYRVTEDPTKLEGYIFSEKDGKIVNTKSEDFTATVIWKDAHDIDNRPTSVTMTLTGYYIDGERVRHDLSDGELAALGTSSEFTISDISKDNNKTTVTIPNLPSYSEEGYPIVYYINEKELKNYSTKYDNGATAYGTNVTQCYNGGTITNTRRDTTTYAAKKKWVDAGESVDGRPKASVYLYRYEKDSGPGTASPVVIMDKAGKSHVISRELPADSLYEISFNDILANIDAASGGHQLFKYDGDGKEYVYFVKEVLTPKMADGNRISGLYYKEYENVEPYANKTDALYEGGTLVNCRIPMVDVKLGKEWKTASLPDVPTGTEVTLKLKVSSDGGKNWTYVQDGNSDLTVTLNGFSADQTTRSQTVTLPKVSEEGTQLQYMVEEVSVKKDGNEILSDGQMTLNGHTYTYTAATLNMADVKEPLDPEENAEAELIGVNVLSDDADYTVKKNWSGFENDEEKAYTVNVQVKRYLYDGTEDTEFTPLTCALTSEEDFKHVFSSLPLYDAEGYRYDYRAAETSVTKDGAAVTKGWGTTVDYNYDLNNKKIKADITNYKGDGGRYITVSKKWVDDGDTQHRQSVVAQVYKVDGTGETEWTGKSVTLSESNGWTARIGFEGEELADYNEGAGIIIREKTVGGHEVDYSDRGEAFADEAYPGLVYTDETDGHIYKVKNEKQADGSWLITNVRVGTMNIEIDKIWQDGSRENSERPKVHVALYREGVENPVNGNIELTSDNQDTDKDATGNTWVYTINDLNKYDDDGKQIVYTIEEADTAALKKDQYVSTLEDGEYDTSKSQYHSGDVQYYTLTNKREGITEYKVYKIWKDTELTTSRPDIRVDLYYSVGDEEEIYEYGSGPLADYQTEPVDYVWSTPSGAADYDRMCTVPNLMAFSPKDGSEIHYYSKETMAVPEDYKTYYWQEASCETKADHFGEDCAADGEYIENRTDATININGTKLWMNLQNGTRVEDLDTSKITISLYHYVKNSDGSKPSDFDPDNDPDNKDYFVKSINMKEFTEDNRKFLFENVAKYDPNGKLYTYEMRESIGGKMGYVYHNDPSGFQITNTFVTGAPNNRTIKVQKSWDKSAYKDGIPSSNNTEFTYPKVTFDLYRSSGRSETDNEMDYSKPVATVTVATAKGEESGVGEFPAQLIWSENGVQYEYAVKERTDGLPAYIIPEDEQTVEIDDEGAEYTPDDQPEEKQAEFENTYEFNSLITLKGTKKWEDENNAGLRPDDVTLNVFRKANGTAASTAIGEEQLLLDTDYTVTWTKNDNNTWDYEISGPAIAQYSPNGQAFIYRITEEVPENYAVSGEAVQSGAVTDEEKKIQNMTDITNTLNGSYTVSKVWDDNGNEYQLRPTSVVVALQKSTDNGASWEYVTAGNNNTNDNVSFHDTEDDTEGSDTAVLAVRLSFAANKWSYTFPNLDPTCKYRGVEIAAGVSNGTGEDTYPYYRTTDEGKKAMIGSYSMAYDYADSLTTVTNSLDPTTLTITKKWVGDNNNAYDSRPLNKGGVATITVTLQRRLNKESEEWTDVLNTNGKPVTKELSSDLNEYSWEISNLPKCDYSGASYQYRAVEKEDLVQGYTVSYSNDNLNDTVITNTLGNEDAPGSPNSEVERTSITATKKWLDGEGTTHPTVILELTRWVDDTKVPYPETKPMTIVLDGVVDTNPLPHGETAAWTATWNDLPKKDNKGNAYIYKVEEIKIGDTAVSNKKAAGYLVSHGQTVVAQGGSLEISNTKATSVAVTKTFTGDSYATRPTSITVKLQRKITTDTDWKDVETKVIEGFSDTTATNSYTFADLPEYDANNKKYTYRVVETKIGDVTVNSSFASGYDVTYSETAATDTTPDTWAITNTMRTIDITGTKEWDDQNDAYGMRPETVTVKLYAGDELVIKQPAAEWTKNGNIWTFTFSNLPQYNASGEKIVYTVKEPDNDVPTGYTALNNSLTGGFADAAGSTSAAKTTVNVAGTYNGASHGIINKLELVDVEGTKTWTNTINGSGTSIQPAGITLTLMNGNTAVTVPAAKYTAPTSANGWAYKFADVPKYGSDGKVINYTVVETAVPGYSTTYATGTDGKKNVTNTLDTISVTAVKIWDDQSNAYKLRPSTWNNTDGTGLFSVYADNEKMTTQPECTWTVDGTDSNKYTFKATGLQKYRLDDKGIKQEIVYTVKEEDASVPKGYTRTASEDGKTITNTLDTVSIAATKTFAGDTYASRPTAVTFALMQSADGTAWTTLKTQTVTGFSDTVSEKSYTFANVPKYNNNGTVYQYMVVETKIGSKDVAYNFASGYDVTCEKTAATDTAPDTWAITNTMRTIDITGTKEWDDQNDAYGMRPETVTVKLYAGGALVTKQPSPTWTKSGNTWTFTFSDLPQYDVDGNKIEYTVKEPTANVPTGYTAVNNSLTGGFADAADSTSAAKTTVSVSGTDTTDKTAHGIINKLETVDVEGTKTWSETKNGSAASIRPESITLKLLNGTTEVTVPEGKHTLTTAGDKWSYKYEDVPKYDSTGTEITYTVEETAVPGYTTSYDTTHKNVTNTLDTTSVTAVKIWDDQSNAYKLRPSTWNNTDGTGLFSVYADDEKMTTQPECTWTVDGTDSNKYTFEAKGLQKYRLDDKGVKQEIVYTVKEEDASVPKGYTKSVSTDGKTITNELATVNVEGTKTWSETKNGSAASIRPESITLKLLNGTTEVTVPEGKYTLTTADDTWSYKYEDVPQYDSTGTEITYTVEETAVPGYTTSYDTTHKNVTNTLDTTAVTAVKIWDDQSNAYKLRPSTWNNTDGTGLFSVYADGKKMKPQPECTWTVDGTDSNKYTFEAKGLQKYRLDDKGVKQEIVYTVKEEDASVPKGYTKSVSTDGKTITNELATVNVEGTKTWSETKNGSAASIRPESITLKLLNGTTEVTVPEGKYTLTTGDTWSYKYEDVPKYDSTGTEITYTVEETAVPGYTTSYDTTHKNVTNTLDTTSVTAVKIWDDQSNAYKLRPSTWNNTDGTGLFSVYADDEKMTTQPECTWTVDGTDSNKYTFEATGLQKYKLVKGVATPIVYTVKEDTVPVGYTMTETVDEKTKIKTITNQLATVNVEGTKTWSETKNGSAASIRPESITLKLLNGTTEVTVPKGKYTLTTADDTWSYKYEDVPKYDSTGTEITYTVEETAVPGYTTSYDMTHKNVTNTLDTTSVTAVKIWDDQNNAYGMRPDGWNNTNKDGAGIGLFTVYADNKEMTTQPECTWTVDGTDSNKYTFEATGLQKYKLVDGAATPITYTVKEDTVPTGYTMTETVDKETNIKTVTNTLQTTTVTAKKIWDDDNDRDGKRPASVTFTLKRTTGTKETGEVVSQKEPVTKDGQKALTSYDGNTVTWTDLPKVDKDGNTITYYVVETNDENYSIDYSENKAADGSFNYEVTNTYGPETVGATVAKKWDDQNNKYGDRPGSITFELWSSYTDDEGAKVEENVSDFVTTGENKVEASYVLKAPAAAEGTGDINTWTQSFTGLPKYRPGQVGKELTYYVKETRIGTTEVAKKADSEEYEDTAAGYSIAISSNGEDKIITNTQNTTTIKVTKEWANTDKIGTDPNEVESASFRIMKKPVAAEGEGTTGTSADWTALTPDEVIVVKKRDGEATLINLPVCDKEGDEYLYKAVEIGYTLKDGTFVEVSKNNDKVGAYAVTYGTETGEKLEGDTFRTDVTNTLELTKAAITNYWVDDNDRDGKRPDSVTYVLKRKPVNAEADDPDTVVGDKTVLADQKDLREYDDNIVEWDGLPVKDQAGNEYIYWIEEEDVGEYGTVIEKIETDDGSFIYKSTNTHELETRTFVVKKSWDDENNYDNLRPGKVTFKLYADKADTGIRQDVKAGEKWTATIESTDEYTIYVYKEGEVGVPVKYSLKEVGINGYIPRTSLKYQEDENGVTYGLFKVTNVHEVIHGGGTDGDQSSNSKPVVPTPVDKKPDQGGIGGSSLEAEQENNSKPEVELTDSQGNTKSPSQNGTQVYTPGGKLIGMIYDSDPYSVVDSNGNIVAKFDPADSRKLINTAGEPIDWTFAKFTGDDSNMDMYLIIMLSSLGALLAFIADRKRRKLK